MGDKLREIIDDESMDHMGFEEKIKLMLDAETIARSDRKVERLIRQARFEYKDASIEGIQLFCFNVCSTGSAVFFRSVG